MQKTIGFQPILPCLNLLKVEVGLQVKMVDVALKGCFISSDEGENMFVYSLPEVDQDNGVTGFQNFLMDAEFNRDCLDGTIGFGTFDSMKDLNTDSSSFDLEYKHIKFDSDALDLFFIQGEEETKENDDRLGDTDEKVLENFGLPNASEETLLESQSSLLQGSDCGSEHSDLSSESVAMTESSCHKNAIFLDQMTVQGLREVFCRMFGHETSVIDKQWLKHRISYGLQNQASSRSAFKFLADVLNNQQKPGDNYAKKEEHDSCYSSNNSPSLVGEVGRSTDKINIRRGVVTQKRTRKTVRTRRFIQPPQVQKSRYCYRTYGLSNRKSGDMSLMVRSHRTYHHKGSVAAQIPFLEESLKGSSDHVSCGPPVQKRQPKEYPSYSGYNSSNSKENSGSVLNEEFYTENSSAESQDYNSEDDCVSRSNMQRARKWKRQNKRWTTSEVMKLIKGVSQHGVGKWSRIKRELFSSSYRSSVNLKDKWRNLLKASCNQVQEKRKVQQGQVQESNQLPESVKRRVRELAVMYAYPKESNSNVSCSA